MNPLAGNSVMAILVLGIIFILPMLSFAIIWLCYGPDVKIPLGELGNGHVRVAALFPFSVSHAFIGIFFYLSWKKKNFVPPEI